MDFENDELLEKHMLKTDQLISEGKIPSSSKVIPVHDSLGNLQWVLPTNQVIEIIRNVRSFALTDCICRTTYKRCNRPVDVCLVLNDYADLYVKGGKARYITLEEAVTQLKLANEKGLVHLTLFDPKQHIAALCSCCECCCKNLQIMIKFHRPDFITYSDYVAKAEPEKCIQCGKCIERCVFGAQIKNGEDQVEYHPEFCYGCGLCSTTCPTQAITMNLRKQL
jgi:Pyruvate/2-oxoacid:ferredoxin oxidoreductase delta subunit